MGCTSIFDDSVGAEIDYPDDMEKQAQEEIEDPKNGIAANLDQDRKGTCVRYALAACLYE